VYQAGTTKVMDPFLGKAVLGLNLTVRLAEAPILTLSEEKFTVSASMRAEEKLVKVISPETLGAFFGSH